ncbi:MAG: VOC family protein [Pseudomonadota bacterium]
MLSYFTVGTNNLPAATRFYDALMADMGATKVSEFERGTAWGWGIGTPMFIIMTPFDQNPATVGNGTMVSFDATSPEQVNALHAKVLAMGGSDEGAPGMRGEALYVGYCRDLDGNKMNFIHYLPPK